MLSINQGIKNIKRARQIAGVMVKYGFRDIIHRLPPARRFLPTKIKSKISEGGSAERLRKALEELGVTFVKLGQVLSVRSDIFPRELTEELSKLQDEVEPMQFEEVREVLEEELDESLRAAFTEVERKAIASASLSQVHRARHRSGERVVIKVQRKDAEGKIKSDLSILKTVARWVEKEIPEAKKFQPLDLAKELEKNLKREIRFKDEANAIEKFHKNFKDDDSIILPRVYWKLTTQKVLTMQYIEGVKVTDPDIEKKVGLDSREMVEKIGDFIFTQIFEYNYFHGDPHPGNILVTSDGKISMLDYGLTGTLDEETIFQISDLVIAVLRRDSERVMDKMLELGAVGGKINRDELKNDIRHMQNKYYGVNLQDIEVQDFVEDMFDITRKHGLKIPRNLLLLIKTLSTLEGVVNQLHPSFNITENIRPYMGRLIRKSYSPKRILKELRIMFRSYFDLIKRLPDNLSTIIREVKDGTITVNFEHRGLDNLILHGERSANRLSLSLIIAALIVGSALIIQTGKLFTFGIVGFAIAGILGLLLIIAIIRSGRF